MPLVNRLLDAFFRTLDVVDTARERLDRVLGRNPEPGPSGWDANPEAAAPDAFAQQKSAADWNEEKAAPARPAKARAADTGADEGARPKGPKAKAAARSAKGANGGKQRKSGAASKGPKAQKASRKGSVDRTGADFDSPRARAVLLQLQTQQRPVVAEDAAVGGKKVLARVIWALQAAHEAGSEQGLTAADASALLHLAAGMDVFSTNIARACRDETALIHESEPDGRIKRYRLSAAGRAAAAQLSTRPIG